MGELVLAMSLDKNNSKRIFSRPRNEADRIYLTYNISCAVAKIGFSAKNMLASNDTRDYSLEDLSHQQTRRPIREELLSEKNQHIAEGGISSGSGATSVRIYRDIPDR